MKINFQKHECSTKTLISIPMTVSLKSQGALYVKNLEQPIPLLSNDNKEEIKALIKYCSSAVSPKWITVGKNLAAGNYFINRGENAQDCIFRVETYYCKDCGRRFFEGEMYSFKEEYDDLNELLASMDKNNRACVNVERIDNMSENFENNPLYFYDKSFYKKPPFEGYQTCPHCQETINFSAPVKRMFSFNENVVYSIENYAFWEENDNKYLSIGIKSLTAWPYANSLEMHLDNVTFCFNKNGNIYCLPLRRSKKHISNVVTSGLTGTGTLNSEVAYLIANDTKLLNNTLEYLFSKEPNYEETKTALMAEAKSYGLNAWKTLFYHYRFPFLTIDYIKNLQSANVNLCYESPLKTFMKGVKRNFSKTEYVEKVLENLKFPSTSIYVRNLIENTPYDLFKAFSFSQHGFKNERLLENFIERSNYNFSLCPKLTRLFIKYRGELSAYKISLRYYYCELDDIFKDLKKYKHKFTKSECLGTYKEVLKKFTDILLEYEFSDPFDISESIIKKFDKYSENGFNFSLVKNRGEARLSHLLNTEETYTVIVKDSTDNTVARIQFNPDSFDITSLDSGDMRPFSSSDILRDTIVNYCKKNDIHYDKCISAIDLSYNDTISYEESELSLPLKGETTSYIFEIITKVKDLMDYVHHDGVFHNEWKLLAMISKTKKFYKVISKETGDTICILNTCSLEDNSFEVCDNNSADLNIEECESFLGIPCNDSFLFF